MKLNRRIYLKEHLKPAPKKAKPALKEIVKKVKEVVTSKDDAETEE